MNLSADGERTVAAREHCNRGTSRSIVRPGSIDSPACTTTRGPQPKNTPAAAWPPFARKWLGKQGLPPSINRRKSSRRHMIAAMPVVAEQPKNKEIGSIALRHSACSDCPRTHSRDRPARRLADAERPREAWPLKQVGPT